MSNEQDALRKLALRSYRVIEWLCGEGFVGSQEDPDELLIDLSLFLSVETDDDAVYALNTVPARMSGGRS